MDRKYDIITVLDTCVDLLVDLGDVSIEFNQKEKWIPSFDMKMGGSSCIFACQTAKLGLRTLGIGVVGTDAFGHVVMDELRASGVDTTQVAQDSKVKTALGVALKRDSDRAILTYSGTIGAVRPSMITDELLASARHLHIGSYYLLDGIRDNVPDLLCRAKALGLTVSLDTNWDPKEEWRLPDELFKYIDVFLPNENEVLLCSAKENFDEACEYFMQRIPVVAIKQGSKGGTVLSACRSVALVPEKVSVIDTVGAGDSFDGGFLFGFLNGWTMEKCLKAGLYCGSMNTTRAGGTDGQADLESLKKYMAQTD